MKTTITFNIEDALKEQFNITCIIKKTNMTDEIVKMIESYIKKNNKNKKDNDNE